MKKLVSIVSLMTFLIVVMSSCGAGVADITPSSPTESLPMDTPVPPTPAPVLPTTESLPIVPVSAVSFEPSVQAFPSVPTFQIGLEDLDGDGDLDAIFANGQHNFSSIWLNDGNGYFADTGQQLTQQGHGVDVGDLDGDGDLDLFLTCHSLEGPGSGKPSKVYLNDGSGVFHENGQDLGDTELSGNAANLADIDMDGDLDAIVAYYERGNFVYLNDGKANFALSEITFPTPSVWGDLDSDGDVDVFSKEDGVGYQSMLNDGTGHFTEDWVYKDTTAMIHGDVALGDVDNDGDLDVIITNGDWRSTGYPALVFFNAGGVQGGTLGQFTDSGQRLSAVRNASVNLGDLNGDNYLDLVFTDFEEPNQIWINDGAGQFIDSEVRFGADQFYRHAHLGDLDGDGDLDIFLATFGFSGGPNEIWFNLSVTDAHFIPAGSQACTSFCLDNNGYSVFGTNFDNQLYEGLLFVNKRDVSKQAWDPSTTGEYAQWTSKYGSVTFNLVGYQFVWAGINEAGLMLSTMYLEETESPALDGRPPLESPVWLQYQLDNYSTIEEVTASDVLVRIANAQDHYLVCDRTTNCATIEFLNGEMVARAGQALPVAALANSVYEESVHAWQEGDLSDNSLHRFGIVAERVVSFASGGEELTVDYAFDTLAQVGNSDWTQWSIVFDAENLRVYFRTRINPEIRYLDLDKLDFACGTPVEMLDVHENLAGDISGELGTYSRQVSFDHMTHFLKEWGLDTPPEWVETFLREAENFPCKVDEVQVERDDNAEFAPSPENIVLSEDTDAEGARALHDPNWSYIVGVVVIVVIGSVYLFIIQKRLR